MSERSLLGFNFILKNNNLLLFINENLKKSENF